MSDYGHAAYALARLRAHDEGRKAGEDGLTDDANPYRKGGPEFRSWRRAWHEAVARETDPSDSDAHLAGMTH